MCFLSVCVYALLCFLCVISVCDICVCVCTAVKPGEGKCAREVNISEEKDTRRKASRVQRRREQQMGFGTALPGSLPALLRDLLPMMSSSSDQRCDDSPAPDNAREVVICDVGAGSGNVLSDVEDSGVLGEKLASSRPPLWGVEMNLAFCRSGRTRAP